MADSKTETSVTKATEQFPLILKPAGHLANSQAQSRKSLFKQRTQSSEAHKPIQAIPQPMAYRQPDFEQMRLFMLKGDSINANNRNQLRQDERVEGLLRSQQSAASLFRFVKDVSLKETAFFAGDAKAQTIRRTYVSTNKASGAKNQKFIRTVRAVNKKVTANTTVQTDNVYPKEAQTISTERRLLSLHAGSSILEEEEADEVLPQKNMRTLGVRAARSLARSFAITQHTHPNQQQQQITQRDALPYFGQTQRDLNRQSFDFQKSIAAVPPRTEFSQLTMYSGANRYQGYESKGPELASRANLDSRAQNTNFDSHANNRRSNLVDVMTETIDIQTTLVAQKQKETNQVNMQFPQISEIRVGQEQSAEQNGNPTHQVTEKLNESSMSWIRHYHPKGAVWDTLQNGNFTIKKYKDGVYFGELDEQQRKHGRGIIFYFNGRTYEGYFEVDTKHGKGFEAFPDGSTYKGEFKKGVKEGMGKFEWPNGEVYDGQWTGGKKHGSGMWRGPKGESYIGEWTNGVVEGFGVFVSAEGDRYQGEFRKSLKHGLGTQRFKNGETFVGSYHKNRPDGEGEYYWSNGDYYKGQFSNGLRHGRGTLTSKKDSMTYDGEYRNDKKCGYGELILSNGSSYIGNFENDFRHGYGELLSDGIVVQKGYWINDGFVSGESYGQQTDSNQKSNQKNNAQNSQRKSNYKGANRLDQAKQRRRLSQQKATLNPEEAIKRACGCNRQH